MARAVATEIEETPEADRFDGFPHPRETRTLFGHAAAERELAEAFASGRMHHAWLLAGREGVGKATLAYKAAAHILAETTERQAASLSIPERSVAARQVRALSHPGLLVLRRPWLHKEKRLATGIPVEEVRRLRPFLGHGAGEAWRVVIVDSAGDLNLNAANALLKSLEEPPQRTVFFLVCSEPGRLLVTIRSRCRTLAAAPLADEHARAAMEQALTAAGDGAGVKDDDWPRILSLAGGSPRRGLAMLAGGGLELHARIVKLLNQAAKLDWVAAHDLADELAPAAAEQRYELFFDLLAETLARATHAAASGAAAADQGFAHGLGGARRLAGWAELWETIGREKAAADVLNLDRKTLILETLSRIERAAKS